MVKQKRLIKKIALAVIILVVLFLSIIIAGVVLYSFRISLYEYKYNKAPTAENLIRLSVELVDTKDYDKMMKYLPKALELNDFIEVSEANNLFVKEYQDKTYAAENTYKTIIVKSALSYIYAEKYSDFFENFPKLYEKIISTNAHSQWMEAIKETDKINEAGYENIIKALDENAPILLEIKRENEKEIREYGIYLILKMSAYDSMGDTDMSDEIHGEYLKILSELDSVLKE